jgi:voltage-gated potassium channel
MGATSLAVLDTRHRRRTIFLAVIRIVATTVALLVIYALTPVATSAKFGVVVKLFVGLLAFVVVLVLQTRSIIRAKHPELRAVEALITAILVVVILFAFTYVSISTATPSSFNQPLSRVSSFYFTVTTLGTVGFGDIAAKSDAARIIVTIQILLDLALLVAIARIFVFAARTGVRRQRGIPQDPLAYQPPLTEQPPLVERKPIVERPPNTDPRPDGQPPG